MHPKQEFNDYPPRGGGVPMPQTALVAPESGKESGSGLPVVKAIKGGIEIIDELAEEWRQLCLEGPSDQPFYRPEWVKAYLRNLAPPATKLLLISARVRDRLMAMLPLVEERTLFCGLPVRKLRGATTWECGRFDLVRGAGEEGDGAVLAVWDFLKNRLSWDVIELPDVPQSGAAEDLLSAARKEGFRVARRESVSSPYIPLSRLGEGAERLLSRTGGHFRRNVHRLLRKAEDQGPLRLHRVERADPNALDRFFELESSGWKGRERTAIACKPKNRLFFDEIAQASQQFGYLSLYFLELDGHTISAQFAFTYRSRCFVAKTAYDESYSQYSPTHLLVNAILGDCMERGVSEYDFLGPDEEWKRKWTSQVRPHAFLYIFRKGILGAVLHTVKFSIVPSVKRLLRRNGKWLRRDRSVHSAAENLGSQ